MSTAGGSVRQPQRHGVLRDGQGHGQGRLRDLLAGLANLQGEELQLADEREGIAPMRQAKYGFVRYDLQDTCLVLHTIRLLRFAWTPPKPAGWLFRFECDP